MSTTAQINAYLAWRSEREGKTVDVSPEAYERDCLARSIMIAVIEHGRTDSEMATHAGYAKAFQEIAKLAKEYFDLEDN